MEIPQREQQIGPPFVETYKRPVSTIRAEKHMARARAYAHRAEVIGDVLDLFKTSVNVAEAIKQVKEQQKAAREVDDYSTAMMNATEAFNNLKLEFEHDPDYKTQPERFTKEAGKIHQNILKDITEEKARVEFEKWWRKEYERARVDVERQAARLEISHYRYNLDVNLDKAIDAKDKKAVDVLLAGALNAGNIWQHEHDKFRDEAHHDIDILTVEDKALSIMFKAGKEAALTFIHAGDLPESITAEDIGSIEKSIEQQWNEIEARILKQREAEINKLQDGFVQRFAQLDEPETYTKLRQDVLASNLHAIGQGGKEWWIDKIDVAEKVYVESKKQKKQDPNTQFDPEVYLEAIQMIYDDTKELPEVDAFIMNNAGADEKGNPRLRAKEDVPHLRELASKEKSFAEKTAKKAFDLSLQNKIITPQQYIDIMIRFNDAVKTGDYTDDGLAQLAENMLAISNEEYISDKLRGWGPWREKPEVYIEKHEPERRKPKPGSAGDFEVWMNEEPIRTETYPDGREVHLYGDRWYMLINGTWYQADPDTGEWKPYRRSR